MTLTKISLYCIPTLSLFGSEPLMVKSCYLANISGRSHRGNGDIIYLVVEEQDLTCLLKSIIAFYL